jgi:hypothetical protein
MLLLAQISIIIDNGDDHIHISFEEAGDGIPITGTKGATTYVNENASAIVLGNDLIELGFNKFSGVGLDRIIDKATGIDLRSNKIPPGMMFMFLY